MTDRNLFRNLWIVTGLSAFLLVLGISLATYNICHAITSHSEHTREIGHLLGLFAEDLNAADEIYQSQLMILPPPLDWIVRRILHVEVWIFGLTLLPMAVILFTFGFDRAIRDRNETVEEDSYL